MIGSEEKQMVVGLFPFLSENPVLFDIGSNKGHFTDIFIEEYKDNFKAFLFEPNKKLLSYTEIKYEYQPNIVYNDYAAYKSEEDLMFFYFENYNNELSSLYKDDKGWEGLPLKGRLVQSVMLDKYCERRQVDKIDYLKIDAEGSEVDVLWGCRELFKNGAVTVAQVEYSTHYKRAGHTFKQLFDFATEYGYKVYKYSGTNYDLVVEPHEDYAACDYIITKKEIRDYSEGGWNNVFIENTLELHGTCNLCLEIGCFEGKTTKWICDNILEKGNDARVIAVDPLLDVYIEGDNEYKYFKEQYQRFLRNTRGLPVELKRGLSKDELPKLNALRFDMIYIDGNHYSPWPYFDGCWAFAICKIGGHIIFDDYNIWKQDTKDSIDKFLNEYSGFYEVVKSNYQIMIKKIANRYNEITQSYYL